MHSISYHDPRGEPLHILHLYTILSSLAFLFSLALVKLSIRNVLAISQYITTAPDPSPRLRVTLLDKLDGVEVHIVGGVVGWSELLSGRVDITSSKEGWSTNLQLAGYQPLCSSCYHTSRGKSG